MDQKLPSDILLNILSRMSDLSDIASWRLVCRSFLSLSYQTPSISLISSSSRRIKYYRPNPPVRFKTLIFNLATLLSSSLRKVCLSFEPNPLPFESYYDDDEQPEESTLGENDLFALDFLSNWLPLVAERLESLALVNNAYTIPPQSDALVLISNICANLVELKLTYVKLSSSGIRIMPKLRHLSLKKVQITDEPFELEECFPSLEILLLHEVRGFLKNEIHSSRLKILSLFYLKRKSLTIRAPKLVDLKVRIYPDELMNLIIDAPLLSKLEISIINMVGFNIKLEKSCNLRDLRLESLDIYDLIRAIPYTKTIKHLDLVVPTRTGFKPNLESQPISIGDVINIFESLDELDVGEEALYTLESSFLDHEFITCHDEILRRLSVYISQNIDVSCDLNRLYPFLRMCVASCEVIIVFNVDTEEIIRDDFLKKCENDFPSLKFKWAIWKSFWQSLPVI
ncbi:hypothetical protein LUZ60_003271 [Juncus effusus]|nr:hypothetical protein LUZ60_003271 [Juncus effusus]